jgi:hypothetical protein
VKVSLRAIGESPGPIGAMTETATPDLARLLAKLYVNGVRCGYNLLGNHDVTMHTRNLSFAGLDAGGDLLAVDKAIYAAPMLRTTERNNQRYVQQISAR